MSTVLEDTNATSVLPFTVEVDLPRNGHLMLQSIPGRPKLRSAFDAAKPVRRGGNGPDADDEMVPMTQTSSFAGHPRTPGQRISVDPGNLTYEIVDPMHNDKEACEKLNRWIKNTAGFSAERNGFPPRSGKLDVHRMKTLVRELYWCIQAGDCKVVKGIAPEMEDIDDLPGHYLLNPGATVHNSQPRFEKDYEEWEARLNSLERN